MRLTKVLSLLLLGCASVVLPVAGAEASNVTITGVPFGSDGTSAFPGYGTSSNLNNVVNSGSSGITDGSAGANWLVQGNTTPSTVSTGLAGTYSVDWFFAGAESGYTNVLTTVGFSHTENNQNNNLVGGGSALVGPSYLGTTSQTGSIIPFTLSSSNAGNTVTNGANNKPGAFIPSLVFSYATLTSSIGFVSAWTWALTNTATDWFVFAFDDNGSSNDNHDDYVGIAHVYQGDRQVDPTPLPGALPLMATILGAGYFFARNRKRRVAGLAIEGRA